MQPERIRPESLVFIGVHAKYPILDCVRAEVTPGEIADTLRAVYGEYEDSGLE